MNRVNITLHIAHAVLWLASVVTADGAIVRIRIVGYENCANGQCQTVVGYASGATIGKLADGSDAVLTAAHSYRGLRTPQTFVAWTNGEIPASVVAMDSTGSVDVAVLSVRLGSGHKCHPLMESVEDGAECFSYGFSAGIHQRERRGFWSRNGVPGVIPEQGESGGPVMVNGRIAGLIIGHDGNGMVVETCRRIRVWMVGSIGYIPQCQPPVRPVIVAPRVPPAVAPPPPAEVAAGCDCSGQFADLRAKLAALQKQYGGNAGLLVSIQSDIDRLEQRIAAIEDSKIKVQIRSNGKVIDEDTYPRTGPIVLDFAPVQPVGSR
jgi:hypothetical protein